MQSASQIRLQIETALAHRIPSALTPAQRVIRPVVPTGVAPVDELLDGGLPVGAITEMTGPECSGRTSLAFSFLAHLTRSKFLLVEGPLQNQDGVIHVKAIRLRPLFDNALEVTSHDFH